jgi:hypothetical protein
LIKYGGFAIVEGIASINRNNIGEIMPEKWHSAIISPVQKKGHKLECSNYEGVLLLNIGYKI